MSPVPFPRIGRRVGAYEIVRFIGRGATADVYEGRHAAVGRRVALKLLHPQLAADPVAITRLSREGLALSRVAHRNVVEVLDAGEHEGVPYLVLSLADGEDLASKIRRCHPIGPAEGVDVLLAILSAVAAVHAAGIIHRDLKPSNIRISRDARGKDVPILVDFGIAKLDFGGEDLTDQDGRLGTASYMSPEQIASAKFTDVRSDVYALGVIAYEIVAGRRPFDGQTAQERIHAALTEPLAAPSAHRTDLPAALDAVILRAMHRRPEERFASARELARALVPFATDPAAWSQEFSSDTDTAPPPALSVDAAGELSVTLPSGASGPSRPRRWGFRVLGPVFVGALACAVGWIGSSGGHGGSARFARPEAPTAAGSLSGDPVGESASLAPPNPIGPSGAIGGSSPPAATTAAPGAPARSPSPARPRAVLHPEPHRPASDDRAPPARQRPVEMGANGSLIID